MQEKQLFLEKINSISILGRWCHLRLRSEPCWIEGEDRGKNEGSTKKLQQRGLWGCDHRLELGPKQAEVLRSHQQRRLAQNSSPTLVLRGRHVRLRLQDLQEEPVWRRYLPTSR